MYCSLFLDNENEKESDKMFKIIVVLSSRKRLTYNNIDDYEILDNGATIRFYDKIDKENKRFPYTSCSIVEENEKERDMHGRKNSK